MSVKGLDQEKTHKQQKDKINQDIVIFGKNSIIAQHLQNKFDLNRKTTIGISRKVKNSLDISFDLSKNLMLKDIDFIVKKIQRLGHRIKI